MDLRTFLLVIVSALLHATWNLIAKRHSGNYSIIYLSFVGGWVLGLPVAIYYFDPTVDWAGVLPLILITSVCHSVYGFVLTLAYRHGDISTVYPLLRGTGVALAVTVAVLWLHEAMSWLATAGMLLALVGVVLVSYRRDRSTTRLRGIGWALVCGLLIGSYTVFDKLIVARVHPLVLLNIMQITSSLYFLPYVLLRRRAELREAVTVHWRPVVAISAIALVSYGIILWVFTYAPLSRVAVARELSVAFGAVGGHLLFKESFSRSRMAGVLLILFAILLIRW